MKKIIKKCWVLLLVLTMVFNLGNVHFARAATEPTKLSWEETMIDGNTATFTINDADGYTVTWKSDKSSVVYVDKTTGLVTARQAGKAKISATLIKGDEKVVLTGEVAVKAAQSVIVKTQFGKVRGTKSGNNVTWYGIPYGAEPVGNLRWSAPQNPANWAGALNCSQKEAVALQFNGKTVVGGTNCLNLDVYATNVKGENLPVYVFFHGGNNQTGSSFGDLTGTDMVIKENCIVVSVNYRLGMLGFNCLPALLTEKGSSGNFGLLDMQKSLEWVKNNIQQFGGDPNNVTVSGHSAGGRDVMAMLISPGFKGLFQKAIVSSGGMTVADVDKSASQIAAVLAPIAVADKKAASEKEAKAWLLTTGKDVKEYLNSLSSEKLMSAFGDASIRMSAFPHLYADGVTIPKEGYNTTTYNDVPVIMITSSDEFSFFNNGTAYSDGSISKDELSAAKAFGSKYGSQMYGYFNAGASAQSMITNGYKSPIYLMNVDFGHDSSVWPDMPVGAWHGIILSFLDDNSPIRMYFAAPYKTEGANQMKVLSHQYIKNFLWSGNGNPNSSENTNWEQYTSINSKWLVLDATRDAASSNMKNIDVTSYNQVFAAMDADKTLSASAKAAVIKTVLNGRWFSSSLDSKYGNISLWK